MCLLLEIREGLGNFSPGVMMRLHNAALREMKAAPTPHLKCLLLITLALDCHSLNFAYRPLTKVPYPDVDGLFWDVACHAV